MRTYTMTRWAGLCAVAAGCALFAAPVFAEEADGTAAPADLATLQKRLDALEQQYASAAQCGQTCCQSLCCDPCHCPGVVFGAELALLRFHDSLGLANSYNDLEAAPRIWAGWTGAGGLGARVRWFDYEDTSSTSLVERVRLYTVDMEITDTFQLGAKWSGLLSGGVRYAELNERNFDFLKGIRYVNSGAGPVLGVELYRQVTNSISLFALGRESLIFSDESIGIDAGKTVVRPQNTTFAISEIQLGGEWRKPLQGTAYFFARIAAEGQWWGGAQVGVVDVGLVGVTAAVGIYR
ncbi:MAG: hypothetical protein ABSG86_01025 [Thermoguttaceae bacterium]